MPDAHSQREEALQLCETGDFKAALKLLQSLERRHRETLGKNHPEVAEDLIAIGMLHQAQGTTREAFVQYSGALKIQEKAYGPDDARLVPTLAAIGFRMWEMDSLEGALSVFAEVERSPSSKASRPPGASSNSPSATPWTCPSPAPSTPSSSKASTPSTRSRG